MNDVARAIGIGILVLLAVAMLNEGIIQSLVEQEDKEPGIQWQRINKLSGAVTSGEFQYQASLEFEPACIIELKTQYEDRLERIGVNPEQEEDVDILEKVFWNEFKYNDECWTIVHDISGNKIRDKTKGSIDLDNSFNIKVNKINAYYGYGVEYVGEASVAQLRRNAQDYGQDIDIQGSDTLQNQLSTLLDAGLITDTQIENAATADTTASMASQVIISGIYPDNSVHPTDLLTEAGNYRMDHTLNLINTDILQIDYTNDNVNVPRALLADYQMSLTLDYHLALDGGAYVKYLKDGEFYGHDTLRSFTFKPEKAYYDIPLLTRQEGEWQVEIIPFIKFSDGTIFYDDKGAILNYNIMQIGEVDGLRVKEADQRLFDLNIATKLTNAEEPTVLETYGRDQYEYVINQEIQKEDSDITQIILGILIILFIVMIIKGLRNDG